MFNFLVGMVLGMMFMFLIFCLIAAAIEVVEREEMKKGDKNEDRHINEN